MEKQKNCGPCAMSYNGYCRLRSKEVGYFDPACEDYTEPQGSPSAEAKPHTHAAGTKVCKSCGRELTLDHFSKHARTADGLQPSCKDCMSAKLKKSKKPEAGLDKAPRKIRKDIKKAIKPEDEILDEPMALSLGKPLSEYSAQEIYDELKKRGFEGELTKITKIVLK